MVLTKRTANLPLICQICGDKARGINFEAMTCMSCKAFFRRHALQPPNTLRCQLNDNCSITQLTRSGCSACRLKKCLALGMNVKLIRHTRESHLRLVKQKASLIPPPAPLNLLCKDVSTLTTIEWNLLSNIIHAYDQGNAIEHTKFLLQQQSSLPPKLRSKSTAILDINIFFYSTFQSFIGRVPYFQHLPSLRRRQLMQHNSETTGAYNSLFVVRETNALENVAYFAGCCTFYGNENCRRLQNFVSQIERNSALFKVMLLIMGFSSNCSIVVAHTAENTVLDTSEASSIPVQDMLATMLWKYLNYQYGFAGAVKYFSTYIHFILNILRWIEIGKNGRQEDMLDLLAENIDQSLLVMN